jgi:hypothetical protein
MKITFPVLPALAVLFSSVCAARCEVILDNTAGGTAALASTGAPMTIPVTALIFRVAGQVDWQLTNVSLGLVMPGGSGTYGITLSLRPVGTNGDPQGSIASQAYPGISIGAAPGYTDFSLSTSGWNLNHGGTYALEVSCWNSAGPNWAVTNPNRLPETNSYATPLGYRSSSDGTSWSDSASCGAVRLAGTPTAVSVTNLSRAIIEVSEVTVSWESRTNAMYQVQYCTAQGTNSWVDLSGPVVGTGGRMSIRDAILGVPCRLYRIVILP